MNYIFIYYVQLRPYLRLTARNIEIFEFKYGFTDLEYHSTKETAKKFNVSESRVLQIVAKVEDRIKRIIEKKEIFLYRN